MRIPLLLMLLPLTMTSANQPQVVTAPEPHSFVATALQHFVEDIEAIAGVRLEQSTEPSELLSIHVGTLGNHPQIDQLVEDGKLDVASIQGEWEAYRILSLKDENALVIVGSDPRGTAYGVYGLSEHFGVSPWHWFADVTPTKRDELQFDNIDITWKPSVKYRGIFINDEKWGLQEWATKNFAKGEPLMGAKLYRRVFELLMRMKANSIWPSMWGGSSRSEWPGFLLNPNNLKAAQDYGIVLASSHGETLNTSPAEWYHWTEENGESKAWNYAENFDAMKAFWRERLAVSSQAESLYTIGLRGLNDEPMDGGSSQQEKIAIVENAIQTQRQLLSEAWGKPAEEIPQIFTPYKEVLPLFEAGLEVPDDVTILYTDDDYGFLKRMPSLEPRSGGYGIYYHGDYYGGPKSYLWLGGTAMELLKREMDRAIELGILQTWIVNAGNIKLHEMATEYYIHLATTAGTEDELEPKAFMLHWATREFGEAAAPLIADSLHDLEAINYLCKPDHAMPGRFGREEGLRIVAQLDAIAETMEVAAKLVPKHRQDAFDQLVRFHVLASKYTHSMMIYETEHLRHRAEGNVIANSYGELAMEAHHNMAELSRFYNEDIADGKWNPFMNGPQGGHNWDSPWQPLFERHMPDVQEVSLSELPNFSIWVEGQAHPLDLVRESIPAQSLSIKEKTLRAAPESERLHWLHFGSDVELIPNSLSENFTLSLEVNASHQFAVVFGYKDPANLHWAEFVCNSTQTQVGRILGGSRVPLTWNEQIRWPSDTWNRISIQKQGDLLQVFVDDQLLMLSQGHKAEGIRGQIGLLTRRGTASVRDLELTIHPSQSSEGNELPTFVQGLAERASFELLNQSDASVEWSATASADWIQLELTDGSVDMSQRVGVKVDWELLNRSAPLSTGTIQVRVGEDLHTLFVEAVIPRADVALALASGSNARLAPSDLDSALAKKHTTRGMIHGLGRDGVMLPLAQADSESKPSIAVPIQLIETGDLLVQFHMLPTREQFPAETVRYAIALGDEPPQIVDMLIRKNPWGVSTQSALQRHAVMEGYHTGRSRHSIDEAGEQTLKIWALDEGIDLEGITLQSFPSNE